MSTIRRSVYLSPIEPAPLSLRAPMGIETWLDIQYYSQDGKTYGNDVAAQLQLTSRTGNQSTTYAVPATDPVNGRARAVIPAGDLTDSNGYRLRLVGTVNQQAMLIATGTVMPIQSAGIEAYPQDVIDTIDIAMTRGFPMMMTIWLWHDAGKTNPYDASSGIAANIYDTQGGQLLVPFSIVQLDTNEVQLSLLDTQVNALPDQCWWSLTATTAAGTTTLAQGNCSVTGTAP